MWQTDRSRGSKAPWIIVVAVAAMYGGSVGGQAGEWKVEAAFGRTWSDLLISTDMLGDIGVEDVGKRYEDRHARMLTTSIGMELAKATHAFLRTSIWWCDDCERLRRWVSVPPGLADSISTAVLHMDAWGGSTILGFEKQVLTRGILAASMGGGLGLGVNSLHLSTNVRMKSGAERLFTHTQSGVGFAMLMKLSVSVGNPGIGLAGGYGLTEVSRTDSETRYSFIEVFVRL